MKRIKIFKGAAVLIEPDLEKKGIKISSNTGKQVDEVNATQSNIKKYLRDRKYPEYKLKK